MDKIYQNQVDLKTQELNAIRNRKHRLIQNNILGEDDKDKGPSVKLTSNQSYLSLIKTLTISDLIQFSILYVKTLLSLWLMVVSLVISNLYQFLLRKEKAVTDQNVLITGSGGYLGRYLAIQFAKRGAHLILWDCDSEANNKTLETLKLRGYKKAELFTVDLSDEKQLKNTAQLVRQKFGFVWIVIMAAVPKLVPRSVLNSEHNQDVQKHFLISYMSQLWLIQEFLQSMINRNSGHFVTISSLLATVDIPMITAYSSMKAAQAKLMESVREELRVNRVDKVYTTVVYPGAIDGGSALTMDSYFDISKYMKLTNIEEIAEAITLGILRNKATVFVPLYHRAVFCLKNLISPKIIGLFIDNIVKIKEDALHLKPKVY